MNVNFNRLYRKAITLACITAVIISAAATLFVMGALMILTKTALPELPSWLPYVAAAAALVASAPISFFVLKPSPIKYSKRLDNEHTLRESVQTMVVFDGMDGSMLELQREQADRALAEIKPRSHFVKRFIIPGVALLVGIALTVTGFVIPAKEIEDDTDGSTPEQPFKITEWQLGALDDLIEDVDEMTNLDPTVKSGTLTELQRLKEVLIETTTQSKMENEVTASILAVDLLVENASTYKILAVEIFKADNEYAKAIARELLNHNGIAFGQYITRLRAEFEGDSIITSEDPKVPSVTVTLQEKLTSFTAALNDTVYTSSVENKEDKLLVALTAFANGFIGAVTNETTNEAMQSRFDKVFAALNSAAGEALEEQFNNKALCKTVAQTLSDIFGVQLPDLISDIEPELKDSSSDDGSGSTDKESSGGYGEGNELYGSSDLIYDPFNKDGAKYVIYGEVFDDYYKKIEEMLIDGNLSEETKQILIGYFAALSDGTKTGK